MLDKYLIDNYHKLKDMAYNITNGKGNDDLFSFVIEELYKCDQEKINQIIKKNQMTFYIARVMVNQYFSKTSRYFKKYKKYYQLNVCEINDEITENHIETNEAQIKEDRLNWIEEQLKQFRWFDAEIFKIYFKENHSLNSLSKATKINRNTLHHSINKIKNYLKNEKK